MSDLKDRMPLIVIAGPTASGKSDMAVEIARRIDGEVVSADSMQVYRNMDIGSAKITLEEMMGIPHHMIDVADPTEAFDVVRYAGMARDCISGILSRGHVPILCGGTGFYIQAVTRDIDFTETGARPEIRQRLEALAAREGNEALHARLASVDPAAAAEIHPNNLKRVIRALEFYEETGSRISDHNEAEKLRPSPYDLAFYVITDDRNRLYERIDRRVDFMMEAGLWDEVAFLKAMGLTRDMVSMQGLGYKEMLDAMDGVTTYEEAVRILKRDSRHYAKRQITWFKREKEAVWVDRSAFGGDSGAMLAFILKDIEERLGIAAGTPQHPFA